LVTDPVIVYGYYYRR